MANRMGSLEVGKLADLAVVSLSSPNMLGVSADDESLVAAMVFFANAFDVKTVVINEKVVKHSGELKRVRWSDVVTKFKEQQTKLRLKFAQPQAALDWDNKAFDVMARCGVLGPERLA